MCVSVWAHGSRRISCRLLHDNDLTGPVPTELGQLVNLQNLYVLVRPRLSLSLSLPSRVRRHVVCVGWGELMVLVETRAGSYTAAS